MSHKWQPLTQNLWEGENSVKDRPPSKVSKIYFLQEIIQLTIFIATSSEFELCLAQTTTAQEKP